MLCMFAEVCQRESRKIDEFARLGGDEFGFLLPGLRSEGAQAFADRVRQLLGKSVLQYRGEDLQATVSVGVITWTPAIENSETLMFLIDTALQTAKKDGKDRTFLVRQSGL